MFASIITMTPGTVSAVVDESDLCIWVHALDCTDEVGMVADMKSRYESPLLTIFGVKGAFQNLVPAVSDISKKSMSNGF